MDVNPVTYILKKKGKQPMGKTENKLPITFEGALQAAASSAIAEALKNRNMEMRFADGDVREYFDEGFEEKLKRSILTKTAELVSQHNSSDDVSCTGRWDAPTKLHFSQIAQIIAEIYDIILLPEDFIDECDKCPEPSVIVWKDAGTQVWYAEEEVFRNIAMRYDYTMTDEELKNCMSVLKSMLYCRVAGMTAKGSFIYDSETFKFHVSDK